MPAGNILVADDDAKLQVDMVGRVVRNVADSFALDWSGHKQGKVDLPNSFLF